jgi:L,D-transpeptidase catalytic domain
MIENISKIAAVLILGLVLQSFQAPTTLSSPFAYQLEVTMEGEDFETISDQLYNKFDFSQVDLKKEVFIRGLKGFVFLNQTNELKNNRYLTIIDYSLSSKKRRMWILDMQKKKVIMNELVAHGKNSGHEYAKVFSNRSGSRQSSLGFYVTGETYNGKHRYSLKLRGLESGYNTNAFARGVVIHGASYVDERFLTDGQSIGRSFGCPAVSQKVNKSLVDVVKGGTCLFIHSGDSRYLQKSKVLNNNLYIPLEELKKLLD